MSRWLCRWLPHRTKLIDEPDRQVLRCVRCQQVIASVPSLRPEIIHRRLADEARQVAEDARIVATREAKAASMSMAMSISKVAQFRRGR